MVYTSVDIEDLKTIRLWALEHDMSLKRLVNVALTKYINSMSKRVKSKKPLSVEK